MASEQQVFVRLLRVADAITRRMTDALEPHRLTLSQYSVLEALRGAGEDGLACGQIAERMITRDPDVTRLLDRLEERGLVSRHRGRPDRRVVRSQLTHEGQRVVAVMDVEMGDIQIAHLGFMGKRNLGTLHGWLRTAEAPEPMPASRSAAPVR